MHITVQKRCGIQYITMHISGYMNAPKEPAFISLIHGMEYLMNHPHEQYHVFKKEIFESK